MTVVRLTLLVHQINSIAVDSEFDLCVYANAQRGTGAIRDVEFASGSYRVVRPMICSTADIASTFG